MIKSIPLLLLSLTAALHTSAQAGHHYNLATLLDQNRIQGDTALRVNILNDKDDAGAITVNGTAWLKDVSFTTGTIDIDLRGKNVFLQSFLGVAFHGVNDSTYDVVYFRPFNFKHEDTARRKWSVQYMSLPDFGYDKLRKEYPNVYENAIKPPPGADDWFHVRLVVDNDSVTVYVNHEKTPSLKAHLLNDRHAGKIALWAYTPGVSGNFSDLQIGQ